MNGLGFIPTANDLDTVLKILAAVGNGKQRIEAVNEIKALIERANNKHGEAQKLHGDAKTHREAADKMLAEITRREAALETRSRLLEQSYAELAASHTKHDEALAAHKKAVEAHAYDVAVKNEELDSREKAIAESEAALVAAHEKAKALNAELKDRHDRLKAAMA